MKQWAVVGLSLLTIMGGSSLALAERITIAATVNDDVITSTDLDQRRALVMETSGIPQTPENIVHIMPRILDSLIDETLEMQEAKRLSITISDDDVTKALDEMSTRKNEPVGGVLREIEAKGLSVRSLQNQIRSQLAWNKVIQRKVRRNVVISQDELTRAQQAVATSPGVAELKLAALLIPITGPDEEAHVKALIEEIAPVLARGEDITTLAAKYDGRKDILYRPPAWISEDKIPPDISLVLRDTKTGTTTTPIRSGNVIQFITVVDRRTVKTATDATTLTVKQISLDVPPNPDKELIANLAVSEKTISTNPGSCEDTNLPSTPLPATVAFARTSNAELTPSQRDLLAQLAVGQVSAPFSSEGKVRMVLLCERSESAGAVVDKEKLRQQLYSEKIELEAQKLLRNLRRDATIDIRDK
jgi:peptidyl-prolyl cis-trans isomerase SurA